jgi:hypothetical protein
MLLLLCQLERPAGSHDRPQNIHHWLRAIPAALGAGPLKQAKVDMLIDTRAVAASSATRLIVTAAASPRSWRSEPAPAWTT